MSKENVKAFYELAAKEEGVRNKLVELFKPYEGKELSEEEKIQVTEALMIPVAAEHGLSFTKEEWLAFVEETTASMPNQGELSEDELESVAGGFGFGLFFCFLAGVAGGVITGFCWGPGVVD